MRNWTALENDIALLQSQPCLWPDSLSPDIQKRFLTHNHDVLEKLIMFTRLLVSDEEKEMRLRQFLEMRWSAICNSSVDYTHNPGFPANQACLKTAVFIAKKDEAVCQIVMPFIKKILGTGFLSEDISSASEDLEGRFIPQNFLICLNNDEELISIADLYSLARADTNHLFHAEDQDEQLFHLTAEDKEKLRLIAGKKSENYFDALHAIHRARYHQTLSVGFALKNLQKALMKSSKQYNGSDDVANIAECRQPIFQFYRLWTVLPHEIKNKICDYKVKSGTLSLESYLLCLFVHIKEYCPEIEISELEFQRVCSDQIFPCTHQIAVQLDTLLNHNPDLFNMSLNNDLLEGEVLPNAQTLELFSQQLEDALLTRLPVLGWHDQHSVTRIICFDILSQHCGAIEFLERDIAELSAVVKTVEELTDALIVLPLQHWNGFFHALDKDFVTDVFSALYIRTSLAYVLTHLPLRKWTSFFVTLDTVHDGQSIYASVLGAMSYELSESKYLDLVHALEPILDKVFVDANDIFHCFVTMPVDYWGKIYAFFAARIETIFEDPHQMVNVFKLFRCDEWPRVSELFKKNISVHMKHSLFLEGALKKILRAERLDFLKQMSPYIENLSLTSGSFIRILKLFSATQFFYVFDLMGKHHCSMLIKTGFDLILLLNEFTHEDRSILVSSIPIDIDIQMDPENLVTLLKRFPECEYPLLRLIKMQLPRIIYEFLSAFSLFDSFGHTIPQKFISAFKFLSIKILPVILSSKNMPHFSSRFFHREFSIFHSSPNFILLVYQDFKKIEHGLLTKEFTPMEGVMKKIALLNDFVRETLAHKIPYTSFYEELQKSFGDDFFAHLDKYMRRFHGSNVIDFHSMPVAQSGNSLSLSL